MLTEQDHQLDCALDLMRRLPPHHVERNLSNLIDIVPDLCEDLLSSVDQPLKIQKDKEVCYNFFEAFNTYNFYRLAKTIFYVTIIVTVIHTGHHGLESTILHQMTGKKNCLSVVLYNFSFRAEPSEYLRKLEIEMNDAFNQYREMYFEGGVR